VDASRCAHARTRLASAGLPRPAARCTVVHDIGLPFTRPLVGTAVVAQMGACCAFGLGAARAARPTRWRRARSLLPLSCVGPQSAGEEQTVDAWGPEQVRRLDRQIVELALPALVALCAEPLLSIIDTGFIGRLADPALCLGGLAVATSVFDFVFRAYNFLCVVTVPLVAQAAVAQARGDPDAPDPNEITGRVIGLAAFLGAVTWLALVWSAPFVLQLAGAEPGSSLGAVAASYLTIRAGALPASLMNTVAVGALRGQLDTATPLRVVAVQTFANLILDAVLVFGVEPLGVPAMGIQGAALATALAVWLACGVFCVLLTQRGLVRWSAALTWPFALAELRPLLVGSFSQLVRTLSLQAVLLEFTRTVTSLDASGLAAAAHSVALRTWFFALFALDSIAVAAQGLLPNAAATCDRRGARRVALRVLLWGFAGGVVSGVAMASTSATIPLIFTDDALVQDAARPLILVVATLQPLAGLVFTWDGIFQGMTDYAYLAAAMALSAGATLCLLQVDGLSGSLQGVWTCFTFFLLCRAIGLAWRFWSPGPLSAADD